MNPVDFAKVLLVSFVTLFPVVNPIGDAPIFLALTQWYPNSVRKVLARKIAAYGTAALVGMFLLCLLVMVCYGNAERLVKVLGKSGTTIMTRLSAFILLAIGVQIMWNGLSSGLPQLFSFLKPQ